MHGGGRAAHRRTDARPRAGNDRADRHCGAFTADRGRAPPQLRGDHPNRRTGPSLIRNHDALVLGQVASRDCCRPVRGDHRRIVQRPPADRRDVTPVPPPCPSPPSDPDDTARLAVAHSLGDQPFERSSDLRQRHPGPAMSADTHLQLLTSGVATLAGIRQTKVGPGQVITRTARIV